MIYSVPRWSVPEAVAPVGCVMLVAVLVAGGGWVDTRARGTCTGGISPGEMSCSAS